MKRQGVEPELPENPAPFLVDWLFEIGPTVSSGMGSGPIGWRDISAWQDCTGIILPPWQARLLRRLSREYLNMRHDAEKPECRSPMIEETEQANRDRVTAQFKAMFKVMASRS